MCFKLIGTRASASLDALLSQPVAQLAKEETRLLLGGRQDQRGMRLDPLRGVIAAHRLGRDMALLVRALRPAAGAGHADPKASCGSVARGPCRHGSHDTLA